MLAAQPLHWVYDLQKLRVILDQDPNPEFRAESANPFYRRQTGQHSCYGDQAFVLLESLSECGGKIVCRFVASKLRLSLGLWTKGVVDGSVGFVLLSPCRD